MNYFDHLRALGYPNVLPIVPPGVDLHPKSGLALKLRAGRDERGKVPGYQWAEGEWGTLPGWDNIVANDEMVAAWEKDKAGTGLRTGDGVMVLDLDATEEPLANEMEADALASFGPAPLRVGMWPKRALVYRIDGSMPYETISYTRAGQDHLPEAERVNDGMEFSAGGRQMVMFGRHPKTGKPYEWRRELVAFDKLTFVSAQAIEDFKVRWKARLPAASRHKQTTRASEDLPDQATLRGDERLIRLAVEAIKNTRAAFPTYGSMITMGEAIHGATGGSEFGNEMWHLFCSGWEGGDYDYDLTEQRWRTLDHPHFLGADFVFNKGHAAGDKAKFTSALLHHEDPDEFNARAALPRPDEPAPAESEIAFAARKQLEAQAIGAPASTAALEPIRWARPSEWAGRTPKPREWEVPGWIPRYEVTLFYGDGGIGKTLAIHQYATAGAAGVAWLGQQARKAKVMCFFCEDSEDELMRRQIDINKALGVSFEDIDANLRIASRKYMDNLLVLWDRNTGALKRQAVWEQLRADAVEFGAEVLVIDTIADTFSGSEIDRAQVNAFVKSCLGRLAQEIGGSVIALGHPSVSGKASGSGTSGSTAWSNAVRSRIYLRYPKGVEKGNIRELEGMKLNYGPKGNTLKIRWANGAFDVIASSTAPVDDIVPKSFSTSALVGTVEDLCDAAVFDAVVALPGVALVLKANSIHYAPKVLKRREPDLLVAFGVQEIEEALARLERRGAIVAGQVGKDASRRPVLGYAVDASKMSVGSGSIFD